jgi:predicted nucleotidyltransferase/DNA-binding transcriptional ArsR family regulator
LSTIVLVFENNATTDLVMGRSSVRRRILTVLAQPETRLHLREIQRRAGTSPGTASRELGRLVAAGLIEREAEGNQVYFRGASTPLATMLRSLLAGPGTLRSNPAARPVPTAAGASPRPSQPHRSPPIASTSASGAAQSDERAKPAHPGATSATPPAAGTARAEPPSQAIAEAPDVAATVPTSPPDELGLTIAARLAARIRPSYGSRLLGIFLYGARARGEARPDSNVDVLLVLDHVDRYCDELGLTSAACADLSQEESLVVSRVFVSETAWRNRADGQLPAIRKEAVAI